MSRAYNLINELIEKKAQGNNFQVTNIKMKLMFKGVVPDKITQDTPDSKELITKILDVAKDFNITLTS